MREAKVERFGELDGGRDKLRILWLKVGGLWPANTGGRLRSYHLLRELGRRHELTLLTTLPPGESAEQQAANLPECRRVLSLPWSPAKVGSPRFLRALAASWFSTEPVDLYKNRIPALREAAFRELAGGGYDLCIADFLTALPNVPEVAGVPVLHFSHNVEHMIWRRLCDTESNLVKRLLLALEWRKMRRAERRACRESALTVTVSEEDRKLYLREAGPCPVRAIPTGVDTDYFKPDGETGEQALELVFSGSMDWHPNDDAMRWCLDEILPRLRAARPGLSLTIIGRNPSPALRAAAERAGARVTGTVPDVRPLVQRGAVYVVPLRVGGGTRLKIFEALALGKAVVSTTVGAEGLPLTHGKEVLLADEPEAFAAAVLRLLDDPAERRRLGEAGRRLVESRYSWARVTDVFEVCCREAAQTGRAAERSAAGAAGPVWETTAAHAADKQV